MGCCGRGAGDWHGDDRMTWLMSLRIVGLVMGAVVTVQIVALARLLGAGSGGRSLRRLAFCWVGGPACTGPMGFRI